MEVQLEEINEMEVKMAVSAHLGQINFKIQDFCIQPASENTLGFLGDHTRIKITIEVDGKSRQLRYFVKTVPIKAKAHYDYTQATRAFYKEIELYKTLFKDMKDSITARDSRITWMPDFYYSRGADLFIVNDLAVDGYYMYPERTVLDLEHMKVAINTIAAMHAASIVFEEKFRDGKVKTRSEETCSGIREATIGNLYPNLIFETEASDIKGHPGNTFWEAGFRSQLAVIDLLPDYTSDQRNIIREKLVEKLRLAFQFVKPSKTFRNVLLHGDLWANNIMFRKNGGKVKEAVLVDFQLARYGPPAHDLLMFFYLTNTRKFRESQEINLLNQYYAELQSHLESEDINIEKAFPRSEFDRSIKYYKEYAILNNVMYYQMILTPADIVSTFLSSSETYENNMYVDRSEMIVACFEQDEICRERMTESMRELSEFYQWV